MSAKLFRNRRSQAVRPASCRFEGMEVEVNSLTVGLAALGSTLATSSQRSRGAQRTVCSTASCLISWHQRLLPHFGQNSSSSHSLLSTSTR